VTVLLFDIDLTLVDSAGAGRAAMSRVFRDLYGVEDAFDGIFFHGRTDRSLLRDALARHASGADVAAEQPRFVDQYAPELARELPGRGGRILPGVRELLDELARDPDVTIGLATGNFRRGAHAKLGHFGLLDRVSEGAFGDDHVDRAGVIADAARHFGREPNRPGASVCDVVVIGDTTLDVAAARANGFTAVGVATGFNSEDELRAAGAAATFADLSDTATVARVLVAIAEGGGIAPVTPVPGEPGDVSPAGEIPVPSPLAPAHEPPREDVEIEAKFAVSPPATVEEYVGRDRLAKSYALGPAREVHFADTYWDTADRALLRAGLSLRTRSEHTAARVTVKGLDRSGAGAIHARLELETVVPEESLMETGDPLDPGLWTARMREAVLAATGPDPDFRSTCIVIHNRHLRDVSAAPLPGASPADAAPGRVVGEMAVEDVVVAAPPPDPDAQPMPEFVGTYAELEVEIGPDGTAADLEAIAAWLTGRPGLAPVAESKLERGLRLVAGHVPGSAPMAQGIPADLPMSEAGRHVWRGQLTEMLLNEHGARRGEDIEFVHDMRVATRRARASAELFAAWFERPVVKPMLKALRTTGRRLGAVRDLDVALLKLRTYQTALPAAQSPGLDGLVAHWEDLRRAAYGGLLEWLDTDAYRTFIADFAAFCATPGLGAVVEPAGAVHPTQVRHVMPAAVLDRFGAVRAYEAVLDPAADAAPSETTLHTLRIECKRLRYALEAVRHLLGEDGEDVIGQLKALQDHLGDLHDAVVARDALARAREDGVVGPMVEAYREHQVETAARLTAEFPPVFEAFVARRNRKRLLRALNRM
jgi:CHAD domain-containing protein/phosphoglycolate phosphatase-like HAD superfamily hydrolase